MQCSSRLRAARASTHDTRGQACWSRTLPVAIQPREGADPSLTNQTCSLHAPSQFCQPHAPHLTASLREQPVQASVPRRHLFLALPTSSHLCPRAYILESNPRDKSPGLLFLPSASCSATPQRSRSKPKQSDLFAPRYASMLYIC